MENISGQDAKIFKGFDPKLDFDYVKNVVSDQVKETPGGPSGIKVDDGNNSTNFEKKLRTNKGRARLLSDGNVPIGVPNSARKSTSETNENATPQGNPWGNSLVLDDKESPIGSLFGASPIETQTSPRL